MGHFRLDGQRSIATLNLLQEPLSHTLKTKGGSFSRKDVRLC